MTKVARWTVVAALFALLLLPLYVSNHLFFPFITGKGFAFRILVEVGLAGYLVLAALDKKYRPRFSWVLALFGAFTAWMAVAAAFSVNPVKAFWSNFERMDGWVTLIHLFAFFVIAGAVLSADKLWRKWWLTFIAVSAIVCGYGVLQLMHVPGFDIHQGGVRVDATFGNAIYLAVYLMFALFVTAWQALKVRGMWRHALIALMALQFVMLVLASSRGAVIGLAAGVVIGSGLWLFENRTKWKETVGGRVAGGVLLGLVLLVGGFFLARDSAFVKNEPALARLATVFNLSSELNVRQTIWNLALQGVAEKPVTGWGQEGFNQVFNKYYEPSLFGQEAWFDRAHNLYIDWLIAGGVPALLLFLALLAVTFIALYRDKERDRVERIVLMAALGAYAVQAIVVFDNLWSYIPFAAILAMAHAKASRPIRKLEALPEVRSDNATAMMTAGAVVLAIGLVWTVNVPNINAANHLVYAVSPIPGGPSSNMDYFRKALDDGSYATQEIREQLTSYAASFVTDASVPAEVRSSSVLFAAEEMAKEVEASPNDARLRMEYAAVFESIGDYGRALEQIDAAIALSPKKQALHLRRGMQLMKLGRIEEAKEAFQYAYDLDRSFPDVALAAAIGRIAGGDLAGGKAQLAEQFGTTTLDSDQLFFAYYQAQAYDDLILVAEERVRATDGAASARYRLAQSYAVARRLDDARREIVFTMATHPETKAEGEALLKRIFAPGS